MKALKFINKKLFSVLKGLVIGASMIVPGISGGTMIFITGLYPDFLKLLSSLQFSTIQKKLGFLKTWRQACHLSPVFLGIALGVFLSAQWVLMWIQKFPTPAYCLFSGLILASLSLFYKQIKLKLMEGVLFASSLILISSLSFLKPLDSLGDLWFFFAVYTAAAAMLLPGVSGSYVLILMGSYEKLLQTIHSGSFNLLWVIVVSLISWISCSKLIERCLSRHPSKTMAVLTGTAVGGGIGVFPLKSFDKLQTEGLQAGLFFLIGVGVMILTAKLNKQKSSPVG